MAKHKPVSGKECVRILCKDFGFSFDRQRGSHIVLRKITVAGDIGTVVPNHDELRTGTLKGILKLARVDEEEFFRYR